MSITFGRNHCPFPGCTLAPEHDGEHDTTRNLRIWESGKLTFAVVGLAGYAGMMASAHFVMALFSATLFGSLWYGIYRITELQ